MKTLSEKTIDKLKKAFPEMHPIVATFTGGDEKMAKEYLRVTKLKTPTARKFRFFAVMLNADLEVPALNAMVQLADMNQKPLTEHDPESLDFAAGFALTKYVGTCLNRNHGMDQMYFAALILNNDDPFAARGLNKPCKDALNRLKVIEEDGIVTALSGGAL